MLKEKTKKNFDHRFTDCKKFLLESSCNNPPPSFTKEGARGRIPKENFSPQIINYSPPRLEGSKKKIIKNFYL
jgi:hypothetical protein